MSFSKQNDWRILSMYLSGVTQRHRGINQVPEGLDEQRDDNHMKNESLGTSVPEISVVIPIYEEAEGVKLLIPDIVQTLRSAGRTFEIIAVDDGSRDETPTVLKNLRQEYPDDVHIVRHLSNKGNGAALRTGARVARGDIVVNLDSDGQHAARDLPTLISEIPPYDLVIGARMRSYQGSWYRNLANRFYNRFATWLSGTEVKDLTSGYRAMRRSALVHFLPLFPTGFSAPTTTTLVFLKAGYNVSFVPIDVKPRVAGKSKIKLWDDGARFVIIILRMIMLYDPLRIFLPVGAGLTFLGFIAWIAGLVAAGRLVLPNSAIFLFIAALLTLLLGLVSSQLSSSRIYYHGDETILIDEEIDG
jgi:glycosyltransferase involved in cell wall biosynthesis